MTEEESPSLRQVDVIEMLQLAELEDIKYYELAARLRAKPWDEADAGTEGGPVAESGDAGEVEQPEDGQDNQLVVSMRSSSTSIEVRVRMVVQNPVAEFVADVSAQYHLTEPLDLNEELRTEFAERVGVMAVWPFLREGLHAQGARLRTEVPLLGIIRQGQFRLRDLIAPDEPPA